MPAPSHSVIRRDTTRVNRTFRQQCSSKPSLMATDGYLHYISDIVTFACKVIFFRQKVPSDVAMVRVSADDSQGSIKCTIQFVYRDDPCFAPDVCASRALKRKANEALDTGVLRTFIVALLVGVAESHAAMHELFDSIDWSHLLELLPPASCSWRLPMDMKTGAHSLGIGTIGSSCPYPYTLWSPIIAHSRPLVARTVTTVIEQHQLCERAKPEWRGKESDIYKEFQSVHAEPVSLLKLLGNQPLVEVLVPPPLHLLLGITKSLFDYLCLIDVDVAYVWLATIGVRHSEVHGRVIHQLALPQDGGQQRRAGGLHARQLRPLAENAGCHRPLGGCPQRGEVLRRHGQCGARHFRRHARRGRCVWTLSLRRTRRWWRAWTPSFRRARRGSLTGTRLRCIAFSSRCANGSTPTRRRCSASRSKPSRLSTRNSVSSTPTSRFLRLPPSGAPGGGRRRGRPRRVRLPACRGR